MKRLVVSIVAVVLCAVPASPTAANPHDPSVPGAPGIGDPYFPLDGNGGYDVGHYTLDLSFDAATGHLDSVATVEARATANLSSFNLDLVGLTVHGVTVDGRAARWSRDGGELTITPERGLKGGRRFTAVVRYEGVPEPVVDALGVSGVIRTDDGMVVIGEPHVAATWFPVNDHPLDKASYTVRTTVPAGLEVVGNGFLKSRETRHGATTFTWQQREPMAPYLATNVVGKFDITSYKSDGIRFYDAVDPALFADIATPTSGLHLAISGQADSSYKRLTRTIAVPAAGAEMSFWVTRDTEPNWDYMFVEAHTVGGDDWTTLPDLNGHTSTDTGYSCPFGGWHALHPFLANYQTDNGDGTCSPMGATGSWSAATGSSDGSEQWKVDLGAFAGRTVEVAIAYASDEVVQAHGVFVDDIAVTTGEGTTSFEDDGDVMDGWRVPGPPAGSPGNDNDFAVGTAADLPAPVGVQVRKSLDREPEILRFLSTQFGKYPFRDAGGIVDHAAGLGFALENQTRPIYAQEFFLDPLRADAVVVHELAHQWYGDSVSVANWRDVWLNEGFATYAEWLWSEDQGLGSAQEIYDGTFAAIAPEDPFWTLVIGDPGPDALFDFPVYLRGAMTLHQLRATVGDDAFFRTLRRWATAHRDGNGSTPEFVTLAEQISGQELDTLFSTWLFTPSKPDLPIATARFSSAPSAPATVRRMAAGARHDAIRH